MTDLAPTPGQTIGPFFHHALPYDHDRELVPPCRADAVRLHGYVYDGAGSGIPDALLEIRHADPTGTVPTVEGSLRRQGGAFTGWGRSTTDRTGHYWFSTLEPGPTRDGGVACFAVTVFARGLLNRLFTRAYVPSDEAALAADPLLAGLPADERARLVAVREPDGGLRFDIHLQGERETVFLSFPRHRDRP
ncbi:protocatechuate 3,4-dioxygenase subunit alpha [Nocardioides gansuensis]|uniref:Protocatechuate 3,4-dioxygenase subunit alpha n=1 Tax=Nocardioides gansuensis TaxID=2138300 RepID=A0A2T8F908_9ACTN|nr:protocatechuate 3,4-dioxygenase subunit alpha [Nocardioides gansuensis]PVG82218.1 protocatechuate 3,4-dioxygenase subunit alpha [Nocardioides gansuensis]